MRARSMRCRGSIAARDAATASRCGAHEWPVKHARGSRKFLLRGLDQVRVGWAKICTEHNLP